MHLISEWMLTQFPPNYLCSLCINKDKPQKTLPDSESNRHAQTCTNTHAELRVQLAVFYSVFNKLTSHWKGKRARIPHREAGTGHIPQCDGVTPPTMFTCVVLYCDVLWCVSVCVCASDKVNWKHCMPPSIPAWCERTSQQHCDVEGFKWIRHRFGMQTKGSAEPQRQLVMAMQIGRGIFNPLNAKPNEVEEHFKSKQWKTSLRTLDL